MTSESERMYETATRIVHYRRGQRDIISQLRTNEDVQLLIIAHQRSSIEGCHCGWAEIGRSHARHVLDELAKHLESVQP